MNCLKCGKTKWTKKPCIMCGITPTFKTNGAWEHNTIFVCSIRCCVDYDSGETKKKTLTEHGVSSYEEIIEKYSDKKQNTVFSRFLNLFKEPCMLLVQQKGCKNDV